ncbi:hypothetical protein [Alishewanella longhuensis]
MLAEGIETIEELEYLTGIGIRYLQGYYFAKPEIRKISSLSRYPRPFIAALTIRRYQKRLR